MLRNSWNIFPFWISLRVISLPRLVVCEETGHLSCKQRCKIHLGHRYNRVPTENTLITCNHSDSAHKQNLALIVGPNS